MRKWTLFCLTLASGVALAAPTVKSIELLKDDAGKPGAAVPYFKPSDRVMHFKAQLESLQGSTKAKWVFTGLETEAGKNIKITEAEASSLIANTIDGTLKLPRDWPFGTYQAELFVNGSSLKKQKFYVTPAPAELKVKSTALFSDKDGKADRQVKTFSPKQHKLHFEATLNGLMIDKCDVKWRYMVVKSDAGANREITTADASFQNSAVNNLTGHVSLPRDWPKGSYRADVTLNGRPLTSIPFTVQ